MFLRMFLFLDTSLGPQISVFRGWCPCAFFFKSFSVMFLQVLSTFLQLVSGVFAIGIYFFAIGI